MEHFEIIHCYVRYACCKPVCVCKRARKRKDCARVFGCEAEPLYRDKYYGWQEAFKNKDKS